MRLKQQKSSGITVAFIRSLALICAAVGIIALSVLARGVLGLHAGTSEQEMTALFTNEQSRNYIIVYFICLGVQACAVPLFGLLLVEGSLHTKDFSKYLMRTLVIALICEIPFDLATQGVWLDLTSLNPVFGTFFTLLMLMFFLRYPDNSFGSVLLRILITAAVVLWTTSIININEGACLVLITSALWNFREKPVLRLIVGSVACVACWLLFGLFYYAAAPLAVILIHFYTGEKGPDFKAARLVAYPAILLLAAMAVTLAF